MHVVNISKSQQTHQDENCQLEATHIASNIVSKSFHKQGECANTLKCLFIFLGIAGHTSSGYVPTSSLLPGQQGNSVQHQAG